MSLDDAKINEFTEIIGYNFKNKDLLKLALTHSSARVSTSVRQDNERLEFLGDRVLGLVISKLLWTIFPEAPEGDLAKRYNALVRKETCYAVSQHISLGSYMIMSDSERLSGGAEKETILADACEALLGAMFIDSCYEEAEKFIIRVWTPFLNNSDVVPADAKSTLQEWAQAQRKDLPVYTEVRKTGPDHEPIFTTEVKVDGLKPEQGTGTSKRIAEHEAAKNMLEREKIW